MQPIKLKKLGQTLYAQFVFANPKVLQFVVRKGIKLITKKRNLV